MHVSVRDRAGAALRARRNWEQLAQFCVVGAVGYVVNLAVYASLLHAGFHYLLAATCSFLVAVACNYTFNRHWTFRARDGHAGFQAARFFAVSLAAFAFNLLWLAILVDGFDVAKVPAQAAAIAIATPISFLGNKLWSFRT